MPPLGSRTFTPGALFTGLDLAPGLQVQELLPLQEQPACPAQVPGSRHSALGTRRSALGRLRHSALGTSRTGAPNLALGLAVSGL